MISMIFTGPLCKELSFFTIATAKTDETIQKNSGLSQGPVHPFGGRPTVRGRGTHCIATPRRIHHERAGRRGEAGLGIRQSSFHLAMAARLCVHALADRKAFAPQDLAALLITLELVSHSAGRLLFSGGG
jgi:hypothetical protein